MKKRLVDADKLMERAKMNSVLVTVEHDHHDYGMTLGALNKIVKECELPSAQPQTEWNNHTVACLLAELFGDTCACNYNGIDEWLPEKCEVIDSCPNPVGVACWEQFLKHRGERRQDE